jgi:hypothetical protein
MRKQIKQQREEKERLKPLPEHSDHMTMESFVEACELRCFIDYDGYGYYANETGMTSKVVVPSDVTSGKYDNAYSHVVWFNR